MGGRRRAMRKKGRRGRDGNSENVPRKPDQWTTVDTATAKNEKWETYFKAQGIVPAEEWDAFESTLKQQLPSTFRVNGSCSARNKIWDTLVNKLMPEVNQGEAEGISGDLLSIIPWYPNRNGFRCAVNRRNMRKVPSMARFRKWLVDMTDAGCITRQEEVSMVPPLFLDVQPHHKILDMCASPGSKTSQLLEMIEVDAFESPKDEPEGLVVANDASPKRAHMLVHQCKRMNSASLLVTVHDGQRFPGVMKIVHPEVSRQERLDMGQGYFDRILCDVPCSGDGTMRKQPGLWVSWDQRNSLTLHALQLVIALRAAEILKVGGLMVYSTCALNPIEDEAVVAELLRRSNGALELVDASATLPQLERRSGISTWKVMDRDLSEYSKFEDIPSESAKLFRESMFPPTGEEAASFALNRCMRFLPHDQDTGGFFVCVLKKTAPVLLHQVVEKLSSELKEDVDGDEEKAVEAEEGNLDGADEDGADDSEILEPTAKKEKRENDSGMDAPPVEEEGTGSVDTGMDVNKSGSQPQEQSNMKKVPSSQSQTSSKNSSRKRGRESEYTGEYLIPIEQGTWLEVADYYGIKDFPSEQLFTRSDGARTVVYLSKSISELIKKDVDRRLRLVQTGLRIVERSDRPGAKDSFRLVQEGLRIMLPYMTKRKVLLNRKDFMMLLRRRGDLLNFSDFEDEACKELRAMDVGSAICVLKDEENEFAAQVAVTSWRGRSSIQLFATQIDTRYLLAQLSPEGGLVAAEPEQTIDDDVSKTGETKEEGDTA